MVRARSRCPGGVYFSMFKTSGVTRFGVRTNRRLGIFFSISTHR